MKERAFAFHQWTLPDLKRHFDADFDEGLSQRRAHFRLIENGANSIESIKESNGILEILFRQVSNFFIVILVLAAVISYFVDGLLQSLFLIAIVLINIVLGFFQEYKAEKALSDLKENFKSKTKVMRDGQIRVMPSEELVLGDIVVLDAGDRVPADIRILESESLKIDESALTGESLPVSKEDVELNIDTVLADRTNMAFGSTIVVAGRAKGIVVGTGRKTEFGKIAELIDKKDEKTPLEHQIIYLGKVLTIFAIILTSLIFMLGYMRNFELLPLLTFTIALLVAAVPESLPTVITLSLAIGVSRMAKKKAVVRKLAVVETLGTINIIATDKTGTLTNNELTVDRIGIFKNHAVAFFDPKKDTANTDEQELFVRGVVCSNVSSKDQNGEILGDPVEVAIANAAKNLRAGLITKSKIFKRETEVPFDSEKKYMSVTVDFKGKKEIIAKGSAEAITSFCDLSLKDKKLILKEASLMSQEGLKVIALASRELAKQSFGALSSLKFRGLFALVDEPTPGVAEAIAEAEKAGIRPIMITGDHPETARFIAQKIGIEITDDDILTGAEIERLSDKELKDHLKKVKIFARITPEDKINIVRLLQKAGYSVAVTGDGVNDAPALKQANVGIAMGIKGTDVAKDSADIILSDDQFGTIISAVEYGRAIFDNIKNAIVFLLSGNIDELFLIGFAFLFDLPVPLLTIQILWINMVTDSLPAIALAFEKPSSAVLSEKPRSSKKNSMKRPIIYALLLSLILFLLGMVLYLWGLKASPEKARTLVLTFSVLSELVYAFSIRSPERIWQNAKGFFANKFLIVTLLIALGLQMIIFVGPLAKLFSIVPLNLMEIIVLFVLVVIAFFSAEITRHYFDKKS